MTNPFAAIAGWVVGCSQGLAKRLWKPSPAPPVPAVDTEEELLPIPAEKLATIEDALRQLESGNKIDRAFALTRITVTSTTYSHFMEKVFLACVERAKSDPDRLVRLYAVHVVYFQAKCATQQHELVQAKLKDLLQCEDRVVSGFAMLSLNDMPKGVVFVIITPTPAAELYQERFGLPYVKDQTLGADGDALLTYCKELIDHADPLHRQAAGVLLAQTNCAIERKLPSFEALLSDVSEDVRRVTALVLQAWIEQGGACFRPLIRLLANANGTDRSAAFAAVIHARCDELDPIWAALMLAQSDLFCRLLGVFTFAGMGVNFPDAVLPEVIALLGHEDVALRGMALQYSAYLALKPSYRHRALLIPWLKHLSENDKNASIRVVAEAFHDRAR